MVKFSQFYQKDHITDLVLLCKSVDRYNTYECQYDYPKKYLLQHNIPNDIVCIIFYWRLNYLLIRTPNLFVAQYLQAITDFNVSTSEETLLLSTPKTVSA